MDVRTGTITWIRKLVAIPWDETIKRKTGNPYHKGQDPSLMISWYIRDRKWKRPAVITKGPES